MHIKIVATPQASGADDEKLHWIVSIFSDLEIIKENLSLQDPLNKDEKSLCRWYLEEYLQKEPYSTSKARKAESALECYGQQLEQQLRLSDLISEDDQNINIEIEDLASNHPCPLNSAHQLLWEFLEDESIWRVPTLSIRVRRSVEILSQAIEATERITSWPCGPSSRQQVNLLLVTARDLGGSADDADISPTIVLDILEDVKAHLESANSQVDLKLEVVRPGTLDALSQHLGKCRRLHGHGYFQIIHFDVHGKVHTRKGLSATSMFGFLKFSDPNSEKTRYVPAGKVAKILHEHGIPIVVLNACESARANAGDDANIAKTFMRAGVKNVLAMSYKASQSATMRFLANFYKDFLVEGRSFSDSATLARGSLRSEPVRDARFRHCSRLLDWFVPVIYTSAPDLSLIQPERVHRSPVRECCYPWTTREDSLHGREFDLLRLEKRLTNNEQVYLSGPPGVGKTSFLRYAASLWKRTSFVKAVVFLDFSSGMLYSMDDFFDEAMRQLCSANIGKGLNSELSEDRGPKCKRLLDILSGNRVAFILDGLADFRVKQNQEPNVQEKTRLTPFSLIRFLELLRHQHAELAEEKHIVVVSGRSREPDEIIGRDKFSFYALLGLELAEAIDVVYKVIQPSPANQLDKSRGVLAEIHKIEPLVHLLQGNPAALIQFCHIARDSGQSLWEMYNILHSESPIHRLDPSLLNHHTGLLNEFIGFTSLLSNECFATLVMLAWYWHEGPCVSDFAELLISSKIVSNNSAVLAALKQASRWSYIEFQPENRVSWMHPLFTIFFRIIACSSYSRIKFFSGNSLRDLVASKMGHLVANVGEFLPRPADPMQGLEYAVWLMATVLSPDYFRDINENYWMYLILFLRMNDRLDDRLNSLFYPQIADYPGTRDNYGFCKQNLFYILKLCRGRGILPIPSSSWPMRLILSQGLLIRGRCNVEETCVIANYYEELLKGAVIFSKSFSGRNAVKPNDLDDIVSLASLLAHIYQHDIPLVENRHMEFVEFASRIMEDSERAFGVSSVPRLLRSKCMLSVAKGTALLHDHKGEDYKLEMQRVVKCFQEALDLSNTTASSEIGMSLNRKDSEQANLRRSFLERPQSWLPKAVEAWDIISKQVMGDSNAGLTSPTSFDVREQDDSLLSFWDLFPRLLREYNNPALQLDQLDAELERGHWIGAIQHHSGFVAKSLETLDFDQALDHIDAQESLASQHNSAHIFEKRAVNARKAIRLFQRMISDLSQDGLNMDKLTLLNQDVGHLLQSNNIESPETIETLEIIRESFPRDTDPKLAHNSAPGILGIGRDPTKFFQSFFQNFFAKCVSSDYRQKLQRGILKIVATLTDLGDAEDKADENGIFRYLAQLHDLSEDEVYGELIDKSGIQNRRAWNIRRLLPDAISEIESMMTTGKYDDARVLMARCENIVSLGDDSLSDLREIIRQLAVSVEAMHFANLTKPALDAWHAKDDKMALSLLDKVLALNQNGAFSRAMAAHAHARDLMRTVQTTHYDASLFVAIAESRWRDGLTCCEEWRSNDELWRTAMASDSRDPILMAEESCRNIVNILDFLRAFQELDLQRTAELLQLLKNSHNTKTRQGDTTKFDPQNISHTCEALAASMICHLFTAGPEAARGYCSRVVSPLKQRGWDI